MGKVKRQITSYRQTGESKAEISFHFFIRRKQRLQALAGGNWDEPLALAGAFVRRRFRNPVLLEKVWVLARSSTEKYRHVTPRRSESWEFGWLCNSGVQHELFFMVPCVDCIEFGKGSSPKFYSNCVAKSRTSPWVELTHVLSWLWSWVCRGITS